MLHSYHILLTTILVIVILNPAHGRENVRCLCHPSVGSADAIFSLPPKEATGRSKERKMTLYFNYNQKLALFVDFGHQGFDWRLFDGKKNVYYEMKSNGECIKFDMKIFPVQRCIPKSSEFLGKRIENGELVDYWKVDTGSPGYQLSVISDKTCFPLRDIQVPPNPHIEDTFFYNFTEKISDQIFEKDVTGCIPEKSQTTEKPTTSAEKNKLLFELISKILSEIKTLFNYLLQ